MKLSATHAFNCMVKFGWISCEDIPLALWVESLGVNWVVVTVNNANDRV